MSDEYRRPDPDALLAQIKAQEEPKQGRLRIWLGAAPGVGKTYAMLQEGHRRKSRGTDVVIGFIEPHGRPEIEKLIGDLEVVPPLETQVRGEVLREMHTEAVIARHPRVALVDELAHTNAPGSKHERRYQDVQDLLDAGITVISTLNVQHIESLSDYVTQVTGIQVHGTIPDSIVDGAEQVELIDLPPEILIERVTEGSVCPPSETEKTLANVFTLGNVTALRDLALRVTAKQVEGKLDRYLHDQKVEGRVIGERIMVAIDHRPVARTLIHRGWRLAAALKGHFEVVHVEARSGSRRLLTAEEERRLQANLHLADDMGAEVVRLQGKVADEIIAHARARHVSHLFIGHPTHGRWEDLLHGSVTRDILRKMPGLNVHVPGERSGRRPPVPSLVNMSVPPDGRGAYPTSDQSTIDPRDPIGSETSSTIQPPIGRGRLLLYLGAAPGVGKTFTMLQEGHRLQTHGTDVVVGFVETHGRPHTAEQIGDLEVVPPREISYKGVVLREMDTDAVIARWPAVTLVDELAHTNAPGSRYEKRYEDVFEILAHGIDVNATVNIQHVESLNDTVEQMTGVRVRETVPDWVLDEADQVELIDMAPEALIRRMIHGNIYPSEQARRALGNFFTVGNLTALRDLALRATAKEVEDKLATYMCDDAMEGAAGAREKVLVAVDHRQAGKTLIREGQRMATAIKGELIVVHVDPTEGRRQAQSVEEERQLRATLQLADQLGARIVRLRGRVSQELIAYAEANGVSQIVIAHPSHSRWQDFLQGSVTSDILRGMPEIDVHVVATLDSGRRKNAADHVLD